MSEFVLSGFSDEISPDFDTQLESVKKLGIAYIEIRGVNGKNIVEHSLEEVMQLKKQMKDMAIGVSAIGSPIGKIKITDDFDAHLDLFRHTVAIAKLLETKYIRLFSFFVDVDKAAEYRDEVHRRLGQMVEYAEDQGVILLHENEKEIYGDTPERCLDLYKSINSNNFKLIFDPANFIQCGVETYPHAHNMLKDYVVYYHIKDALMETGEVVPSGSGDGCIKEIMTVLNQEGYQGYLSLEPHLGSFAGLADLEGQGNLENFKEVSSFDKFELAYESLMKVLRGVSHE